MDKTRIELGEDAVTRVGLDSHRVLGRPCSPADWAAEITKLLELGKSGTLDLAKTIYRAKTSLRYGQWAKLWTDRALPFSKRKAEMLVVIGREFGELDAQTFAHLPGGWSILYHLAQLGRTFLKVLVNDGTIHPALTLAEAKALVIRFNGNGGAKARPTMEFHRLASSIHVSAGYSRSSQLLLYSSRS